MPFLHSLVADSIVTLTASTNSTNSATSTASDTKSTLVIIILLSIIGLSILLVCAYICFLPWTTALLGHIAAWKAARQSGIGAETANENAHVPHIFPPYLGVNDGRVPAVLKRLPTIRVVRSNGSLQAGIDGVQYEA